LMQDSNPTHCTIDLLLRIARMFVCGQTRRKRSARSGYDFIKDSSPIQFNTPRELTWEYVHYAAKEAKVSALSALAIKNLAGSWYVKTAGGTSRTTTAWSPVPRAQENAAHALANAARGRSFTTSQFRSTSKKRIYSKKNQRNTRLSAILLDQVSITTHKMARTFRTLASGPTSYELLSGGQCQGSQLARAKQIICILLLYY
jgi:hypothetical protein